VGKVEDMAVSMALLQQHLALPELPLVGRKNVSAPVGLATYNQNLADKVYSLYQQDFKRFGYERDSWRDSQSAAPMPPNVVVPEERFYDEIIERNIIISSLYRERERLQADVRRVSRLHLLDLANALAGLRRSSLALASKVRAGLRAMLGR
jgi:hypothetical protein